MVGVHTIYALVAVALMSTHTRCRKCDTRKALARWPTSRTCKCGGAYRLDAWMNSSVACNCDGYWFVHRQGSGQCNYNPNRKDWRDA